jgi:glutathione reductase (NADPH)
MRQFDFLALGGGNAGLTAAGMLAAAGRRTALIDRGPVGGLCSLNGCNPKKVLVRSTEVLEEVRHADRFGITVGDVRVDWERVIARKESFTSPVTQQTEEWLAGAGIEYLRGTPRFTSPTTLEVNGEEFGFGQALIATGSQPRPLEFPGAELAQSSDDVLALRQPPPSMTIIGAGVIAFEFGHVFARLGSKVTILVFNDKPLDGNDEELVAALVEYSRGLGIEFLLHARAQSLIRRDGRLALTYAAPEGTATIETDFVLNAAGRIPSIGDLRLERASVAATPRGVTVTDYLRNTTNPRVFAAGDAHGKLQLSPVASYEGRIAGRNALEGDVEAIAHETIARAIYTIPTFASVGLTEAEARRRGIDVVVHSHDMTGWKVFSILGEPLARAKVLEDRATGAIVGAHLLHHAAGDQIHLFALAMRHGIPARALREMVYAYPTASSALPYAL